MIYSLMSIPFVDQLVVITAVMIGVLRSFVIANAVIANFIEFWTK
jgi:hypothetical protein